MSGLVDRGCSSLQMDAMCLSMLMMKQEFLDGIIRDDDEETQIMDGFEGESFDDDWQATEAAAIARDAKESAKARGADVVIVDTAGRMQNKTNLMEELRKVHRVVSPHLVLFVGDALAGNDAVEQAVEFQRMLRFDGAVLCKLDTDAKGGAALSIAHATGKPIVLVGVGQDYDDLKQFDPDWLLEMMFE